ncbi:MAG: tryptophan synthase subunit alpha [Desulfurellaceae bacterium]|nr:tryptophan synthase subunit alpha [Desulfurellaceae bacterium]
MTRIADTFAALRARREVGLIPYITAGDPDLETTFELVHELARQGADIIELGVPFSDPMADGPTHQRAAERALRSGTSLAGILELVQRLRRSLSIPIILFTYYNPIFRYGGRRFAHDARDAGVDGVLCVDLPPEEADELKRETDAHDLDLIFLLAPTSSLDRAGAVLSQARGFVYYVSVTGVTGARTSLPVDLSEMVRRIRAISHPVDVLAVIERRAKRYYETVVSTMTGIVRLADSRVAEALQPETPDSRFNWVITSPPYYGMNTYIPDQWLRNWFVGGPDTVDYTKQDQVIHSSPEDFAADLRRVWRNAAAVCTDEATLVVRFGGIPDRRANPLDLVKSSLDESGWRIATIRKAGSAMEGKRQADTFLRTKTTPLVEYDVWARR